MISRPRIRQLGLGELLDESFRLYRGNLIDFIAIAALILVPYTLLTLVVQLPLQQQIGQLQAAQLNQTDPFANQSPFGFFAAIGFTALGSIVITLLYSIIFQPLLEGALAHAISQRYLDRPSGVGDAFGAALRRAGALIGARLIPTFIGFLVGGLIVGVIFGVFAALLGQSLNGDTGGSSAGAAALVFLIGFVVFVGLAIAALFVFIRILFTSQAAVIEGKGALESLSRSWRLTEGSFWRMFGYILVIGLILWFITLIPTLLIVVPTTLFLQNNPVLVTVISTSVSAVTSVIVVPFSMIAYTLLYYDLRVRKEGFDLQQQTETMLTPPAPYGPGFNR